jgi:hypothetical protein
MSGSAPWCNAHIFCCYANSIVVAGIWYAYVTRDETAQLPPNRATTMSKAASIPFGPSTSVFSRIISVIDRLLMASARTANRNGDVPYFGL